MDPDRLAGMLWGAVTASAIGLPFHGKDPSARPPDKAKRAAPHPAPQFGGGKLSDHTWRTILDPLFLTAGVLSKHPQITERSERTLASTDVAPFLKELAREFRVWADKETHSADSHIYAVTRMAGYADSPLAVAGRVPQGPNDCAVLLRMIIASTMLVPERAEQLSILLCKITHRTDSAMAVGCYVTLILQSLLYGTGPKSPNLKETIAYAVTRVQAHIQGSPGRRIHTALQSPNLEYVGGRDYTGRHISSLRCFMWAYRAIVRGDHDPNHVWNTTLFDVCQQGGAATINTAMAGAVLGAHYGMKVIPRWYVNLPGAAQISAQIDEIIRATVGA